MRRISRGELDVLLAHTPAGHRRDRRSLPAHERAALDRRARGLRRRLPAA
jgi:hypothetical protein